MAKYVLGLDMKPGRVTAALVQKGLGRAGAVAVETEAAASRRPADLVAAADRVLSRISRRAPLSGVVCFAACPAPCFFFHNLHLPFDAPSKISQVLPFELEPLVPAEPDFLTLAFSPVFKEKKQGLGRSGARVLAGAVETDFVEQVREIAAKHGAILGGFTVSGLVSALELSRQARAGDAFWTIEANRDSAVIFGFENRRVALIRPLWFGVSSQDEAAALGREAARTLKGAGNPSPPAGIHLMAPEPWPADWRQAFSKAAGPGAGRDGRPVFSAQNPAPESGAEALARAGMKKLLVLDFAQKRPHESGPWQQAKKAGMPTLVLAGAALVLFLGLLWARSAVLESGVRAVEDKIRAVFFQNMPGARRMVDPVFQMRQALEELEGQKAGARTGPKVADLLKEMSRAIGPSMDVRFFRFIYLEDRLQVFGETDTFVTVDLIKKALLETGLFKTVAVTSANMDRAMDRVRFSLGMDIK